MLRTISGIPLVGGRDAQRAKETVILACADGGADAGGYPTYDLEECGRARGAIDGNDSTEGCFNAGKFDTEVQVLGERMVRALHWRLCT